MSYQSIIDTLLSEQWHYFPNKELLVLAIGNEEEFTKKALLNKEGQLDPNFKEAFTTILKDKELLINHIGPFGDEDYFSGIEEEEGKLQYFFEIHQVTQEDAINFKEHYPLLFVMPAE